MIDIDYSLNDIGTDTKQLESLIDFVCQEADWKCWQTGIELRYLDFTLLRVKECLQDPLVDLNNTESSSTSSAADLGSNSTSFSSASDSSSTIKSQSSSNIFLKSSVLYKDCENEFKLKSGNKQQSTFVECYASFKDYKIVRCKSNHQINNSGQLRTSNSSNLLQSKPRKKSIEEFVDANVNNRSQTQTETHSESETDILIKILCNRQVSLKIFALIIEIIDNLLEDWYPDLGTRFMQDSKGDYLVTRLAPCNDCIRNPNLPNTNLILKHSLSSKPSSQAMMASNLFIDQFSINANEEANRNLLAPIQCASDDEGDFEFEFSAQDEEKLKNFDGIDWIYCFMLDDICYSVMKNSRLYCPRHGRQTAHVIAPDLAFEDVEANFLIENDSLKLEALLGRGSFGSVFAGLLRFNDTSLAEGDNPANSKMIKVAVKVLETLNSSGSMVDTGQKEDRSNNNEYFRTGSHKKVNETSSKKFFL